MNEKSLLTKADLLHAIRNRAPSELSTADAFLKSVQACLNGTGPCDIFGKDFAAIVEKAALQPTYSNESMKIGDFATKGAALTPGSIMDFDAIITSTSMDRDKDVLESSGATLDPQAPLLLFHNPELPIGRLVSKTQHTRNLLSGRFSILNTELGRDAAILVEGGAVRISHGFDPEEFEPLKDGRWHVLKFTVLEISLVPVPSNPTAVITAFSRHKLHSPFVKSWAKSLFDARPAQSTGVDSIIVNGKRYIAAPDSDCHCGGTCDDCASKKTETYRHEGESAQDCVSRKIEINRRENPSMSAAQAEAIAYSECGVKQNSESKETAMSDKTEKAPDASARHPDDRNLGQLPNQGDRNWSQRPSQMVQDENLGNGVETFDPANIAADAILTIATGNSGQLAAPPLPTIVAEGRQGEPPNPADPHQLANPTDIAGMGKAAKDGGGSPNINNSSAVVPLDSDASAAHDTAGNINNAIDVDVPGLKAMAKSIKHSGKEGSLYLNSARGAVHHVAHAEDMHPDNGHRYHSADEIHKMYAGVRGVAHVKVAMTHPTKGAGYRLIHKGGAIPNEYAIDNFAEKFSDMVLVLAGEPDQAKRATLANELTAFFKSSMDPVGDGSYAGARVPGDDAQYHQNNLQGVPADDVQNKPSADAFNGMPPDKNLGGSAPYSDDLADDRQSPGMYSTAGGTIDEETVSAVVTAHKMLKDGTFDLAMAEILRDTLDGNIKSAAQEESDLDACMEDLMNDHELAAALN